jgi:hypothetical protein
MLDFNSRSQTSAHVNAAIDAALVTANQAAPPRSYLGGSRLGQTRRVELAIYGIIAVLLALGGGAELLPVLRALVPGAAP